MILRPPPGPRPSRSFSELLAGLGDNDFWPVAMFWPDGGRDLDRAIADASTDEIEALLAETARPG